MRKIVKLDVLVKKIPKIKIPVLRLRYRLLLYIMIVLFVALSLVQVMTEVFGDTAGISIFWGVDSDTSLRAVDVYVTKLRDKLSACDGFKIVTVRGLGYKAVLI